MLYPRADLAHVSYVMPVVLLAIAAAGAVSATAVPHRRRRRWVLTGVAVLSTAGFILVVAPPVQRGLERQAIATGPFRGAHVDTATWAGLVDTADALRRSPANGTLFVLSPRASALYLLAGIRNPTPYDYPLGSQLGETGADEVVAGIDAGDITAACLATEWPDRLAPVRLIDHITAMLHPGVQLPECRLYS